VKGRGSNEQREVRNISQEEEEEEEEEEECLI
jgi:hypothetical protein